VLIHSKISQKAAPLSDWIGEHGRPDRPTAAPIMLVVSSEQEKEQSRAELSEAKRRKPTVPPCWLSNAGDPPPAGEIIACNFASAVVGMAKGPLRPCAAVASGDPVAGEAVPICGVAVWTLVAGSPLRRVRASAKLAAVSPGGRRLAECRAVSVPSNSLHFFF
jgi:hypothetical protein